MLESIDSIDDLKKLTINELNLLSAEIRTKIIDTVSKTGGHLGSSLGAVDLIIALHYVFNSPHDKIIFDVGHQAYAHKILTGRKDRFYTLRQLNGISGFPNPEESIHDAFLVGHGSTSLSAAIGFATARDILNESYHVIAVIGDASISGGLALEALNYIGHTKKNIIIILNDNAMSISPTVGALSRYFTRIIINERYNRTKGKIIKFLDRLKFAGKVIFRAAKLAEEYIKGFATSGIIFEELGYKYVGPVDGHDIPTLVDVFNKVKKWNGPILIHVLTKKGKGYPIAEQNPVWAHGVSPFDISTGKPKTTSILYSDVFGETLVKLAEKNDKIVAITAAMEEGTGLGLFSKKFPNRFFDVGMAEEHAITFAAGLAKQGLKPVVAMYSTFLQRGYDQILHDVCQQKLPIIFSIDRAGIVGEDGTTHQGIFDISFLRHIPNIILLAPKDEFELVGMLKSAILVNLPIAIRYPKESVKEIPNIDEIPPIDIQKAEVVKKGDDILFIAAGTILNEVLKASYQLENENIYSTVVNIRSIKPIDTETIIPLIKRIKRVITVEENVIQGGFGSSILEVIHQHGLKDVVVKTIGIPDRFIEHGKRKEILEKLGLTHSGIYSFSKLYF
jgi:1-deoxy-D-xylulose-5-phosphate synthase